MLELKAKRSARSLYAGRERSRRPMQMAMNLVSFRVTHRPGSGNSPDRIKWQMILVDRAGKGTYVIRATAHGTNCDPGPF